MGGYWGGISPAMRDTLYAALADAKRGHRPHEWEGVAGRLFDAVEAIETAEPVLDDDAGPVEQMAFWAHRVLENDGALSADSSNDLDYAHEQLASAAAVYLGEAPPPCTSGRSEVADDGMVAITEGDMLAHEYEDAIKVTDAARKVLEGARKAYNKARTDEVALELKLNDRRQARQRLHEETKGL